MRFLAFAILSLVVSSTWVWERRNLATIAISISCATDDICYVGATTNDGRTVAFKTTNNGQSYDMLNTDPEGSQLMLLSTMAIDAQRATIAGFGLGSSAQFTRDGQTFVNSQYVGILPFALSQRRVRGTRDTIGMAGYFADANSAGVGISTNGGMNWTVAETGRPVLETLRFGSWPSINTWFLAGGQQQSGGAHTVQIGRITLEQKPGTTHVRASYAFNHSTGKPAAYPDNVDYVAVILRTRDGGRTFDRVFYEEDAGYYFNAIDCPNERTCFVVGEGPAGARIVATRDGGDTWDFVWRPSASTYDLVHIEFVSDSEGWACGMRHDALVSIFLHTNDGGRTWREEQGPDATVCFSLTLPSQRTGRAMVLEVFGSASGVLVRRA